MGTKRFILLYIGLSLLILAFAFQCTQLVTPLYFNIMVGAAIAFKVLFLLLTINQKGFRFNLPIALILTGVALIILASECKDHVSGWLYLVMFVIAISLKLAGVLMLILKKRSN